MTIDVDRWQWRELIASENGPRDATMRHVLHVLSLHMNQLGESCYPSQQTIANRTALSRRTVGQKLEEALNAGWIDRRLKGSNGQGWRQYEYFAVLPDRLEDLIPQHAYESDPDFERSEVTSQR